MNGKLSLEYVFYPGVPQTQGDIGPKKDTIIVLILVYFSSGIGEYGLKWCLSHKNLKKCENVWKLQVVFAIIVAV